MHKTHVVDAGIGTLVVFVLAVALLGGCMISAAYVLTAEPKPIVVEVPDQSLPPVPIRPTGEIGALSERIISDVVHPESKEAEVAYGPLNKQALNETKNGPLLDLIRSRRGASVCSARSVVRVQQQPHQQYRIGYRYVERSSPFIALPRRVSGECVPCQPSPQPNQPSPAPVAPQPSDTNPSAPRMPLPDTERQDPCPDGTCPTRPEVAAPGDLLPVAPVMSVLPDLL